MKKQQLVLLFSLVSILILSIRISLLLNSNSENPTPIFYSFTIRNIYPHDTTAFTQGLVFDNGTLYESTGLYDHSTLRQVDLETGTVLKQHSLPSQYFGEGITIFHNRIIQLTWKAKHGFIYDKETFTVLQEFHYVTEGWGITHNGTHLIMSDGTAMLYFLDPVTFTLIRQVQVFDTHPVNHLNELEYIHGEVYANIWQEERIAIINPLTGQVTGWIDLTGLNNSGDSDPNNVLNGIAYDKEEDRLFITGKRWSHLYEITLHPIE